MDSISIYLFLCPLLFLAGFVDAVGGGGGLISLPAYFMVSLPAHAAIATNKLSNCCGTLIATCNFVKNSYINFRLAFGAVIFALIGSFLGSNLSLIFDEETVKSLFYLLIPICALIIFSKNVLNDDNTQQIHINKKIFITIYAISFFIGIYDGFYGPGTGTFLLIAFSIFTNMDLKSSNSLSKIINLSSSLMSLIVFLLNGQVIITLGLVCAICNMLGGYIGANTAIKHGSRITRPIILTVLLLLFVESI